MKLMDEKNKQYSFARNSCLKKKITMLLGGAIRWKKQATFNYNLIKFQVEKNTSYLLGGPIGW